MNSEGEGNRVWFPHGISSHERTGLPSLPRYDTAEHATEPIGLLPHLFRLQSHVARDRGGAARKKGTAAFSSPHRLCQSDKLSRAAAHAFTGPWIKERGTEQQGCPRQSTIPRGAMMVGQIRTLRVDKGFGFIKDDGGHEYFFHQSAVYGEGLKDLREGDSVEFDVGQGPKGPRAENVRRTST